MHAPEPQASPTGNPLDPQFFGAPAPETRTPIWRMVVGGVAGYAVAAILVLLTMAAALWLLQPGSIFEAGTYRSTSFFEATMLVMGFLCAAVAGALAYAVGRRGATILLVLVMMLGGTIGAVTELQKQNARTGEPPVRPEGPLTLQTLQMAADHSQRSLWYLFGMPFAGAAGAITGAALMRRIIQLQG